VGILCLGLLRAALGHAAQMAHYAEAFTLLPGRCFRMVTDPEPPRQGQPTHCDTPVVWRGRFRTRVEQIYGVDEDHRDEPTHRARVP